MSAYRRQVTVGRRRLGTSAADWLYNAATGNLSPDQVTEKVSQCAADNYRAGGGRISMDEAKAQCGKDIRAVDDMNRQENPHTAMFVVGGLFLAGLFLVTRR